jgi:hypothetical protein
MTPVPWRDLDGQGGRVERGLALLLHQKYPTGWDRAASSGDGGIDFWVPRYDRFDEGVDVWQIKSFSRLDDSRKSQIKSSLGKAKASQGMKILSWHLLTPIPRTEEAEIWFDKLVQGCDFDCYLESAVECDSLAAQYEAASRYAFFDDHERLVALMERARQFTDGPSLSTPARLGQHLLDLAEDLNNADPHFRYLFEMSDSHPQAQTIIDTPGLICARVSRDRENGPYLTVRIVARYPQALRDRPVTLMLHDATFYGRLGIDGSSKMNGLVTDDLPGGLGVVPGSRAQVRVTPHPDERIECIPGILRIMDQEAVIAHCPIVLDERVSLDRSFRVRLRDHTGSLTLFMLLHLDMEGTSPELEGKLTFHPGGQMPEAVAGATRFIAEWMPGREFEVTFPGSSALGRGRIQSGLSTASYSFAVLTLVELNQRGLFFGPIPEAFDLEDLTVLSEIRALLNGQQVPYFRRNEIDGTEQISIFTSQFETQPDKGYLLQLTLTREFVVKFRPKTIPLECVLNVPTDDIESWERSKSQSTNGGVGITVSFSRRSPAHWSTVEDRT